MRTRVGLSMTKNTHFVCRFIDLLQYMKHLNQNDRHTSRKECREVFQRHRRNINRFCYHEAGEYHSVMFGWTLCACVQLLRPAEVTEWIMTNNVCNVRARSSGTVSEWTRGVYIIIMG